MGNFFKHLKLVGQHRKYVRKMCFKMGIPWQGMIHDLSKYSPTEIKLYKYYTGTKSPHHTLREMTGYSSAWLHHKYRNKHHWQYWLDDQEGTKGFVPIKMPFNYVIEMFCDRVGACKAYQKENYKSDSSLKYYLKSKNENIIHPLTKNLLEYLLLAISQYPATNEKAFFTWWKENKKRIQEDYENNKNTFIVGNLDEYGV